MTPEYGGKIINFTYDDFNIFRPIPLDKINLEEAYKGGSFALVPFSNRLKNAEFYFENIFYKINANAFPHSIHGHGNYVSWDVIKKTKSSTVLNYEHNSNEMGWPWPYQAQQSFSLKDSECTIKLTLKNKSNINMPFGFGIHPFFNFDDKIKLKFKAEREWIGLPENFPKKTKLVENNFNINNGKKLWKIEKTICYENFEGEVQIFWVNKNKEIKIKADKVFNHLIVHVPNGGKYFCIEPVSHPTDSFNLAHKKIENIKNQFLKPSESFTGSITIAVD
ncbi:hypothetical protein N8311_01530 [bacterium]|nr:hypothetical protein [bacterium]